MRNWSTRGPMRVWRTARLALGGAAVLLMIGALGAVGASPAQATDNGAPLRPVIVVQPTTTQVNEPVTPSVVVAVNSYGALATWYDGPVVLNYAVNPDSANYPTWNVAFAVGGIATFPHLTFSSVGFGFQLVAAVNDPTSVPGTLGQVWTSNGGASQWSAPFDIVRHLNKRPRRPS